MHKVDALITVFSGPANAIAPLAEEGQLPTFAISSDMTVAADKDFVFNHWIKPEDEAKEYVTYARKQNLNCIAMLTETTDEVYDHILPVLLTNEGIKRRFTQQCSNA